MQIRGDHHVAIVALVCCPSSRWRSAHAVSPTINPYSEAAFKTLRDCATFPGRFGSLADAGLLCSRFYIVVVWYW